MSEKRFKLWRTIDIDGHTDEWGVIDIFQDDIDYEEYLYDEDEVVDLLNEQQKEINDLNQENADLLGDKIRSLDEFEKCTDKLKAKILELKKENEQLKNELRKEKSLREYSDSMYDADLIVNIRFSNGEWKADVSVIDDE